MIRGLDKKERLVAFFKAKGHVRLVLRIVDVLELRNVYQDYLIEKCGRVHELPARRDMTRKAWLLKAFPNGWLTMPIDQLLEPMGLREVERLQSIIFAYADVRRQKGEPHRSEPCPDCGGSPRSGLCKSCHGDGVVLTFIEMSDEEKRLAEGGAL